jgi:putative ABC transport system permease protein
MTITPFAALRLCGAILRLASAIVPADLRRIWRLEWDAETRYEAMRLAERGARGMRPHVRLVWRCLGAFAHAVWLRCDRWRIDMWLQDVKYALRSLMHRRGFAGIAVLTLALGIGANAAIYSAVRAVVLRPLPFPEPERLVQLFSTTVQSPDRASGTASPPDFTDWRRESRSFTDLAAVNAGTYAMTGVGAAEQVPGAAVTGGFFTVFAVAPLHGRTLLPEDDGAGPMSVVLGHGLWVRRFGSDPSVVGRSMMLDSTPYRIVGVMPRGFAYPLSSELWVPQRFTTSDLTTQRGAHYLDVVGRLRLGVPMQQARDEMSAIVATLRAAYPDSNRDQRVAVHELRAAMVGDVRPALFLLLGAVGVVLLIVCVNLANLILTRALARNREVAVRCALGASRFRLVRGLMVESALLALAGGAGGLLVAYWASLAIAAAPPAVGIPLLGDTRIDWSVVAFTIAVSLATAVLVGLLPAWHTSSFADVATRIREESNTTSGLGQRQRVRAVLIVAETALAVVLLVGAGLLLRSFVKLSLVDLGFDAARVQTMSLSLPDAAYPQPVDRAELVERLLARISALPDVEAAGAVFGLPLTDFRFVISMSTLDGRRLPSEEQMARSLQVRVVTPDYFRAMGIPIVRGRALTASDRRGAAAAVVINEAASRLLWADDSAIGHEFTLGTRMGQGGVNAGGTVVGVARDVRDFGPGQPVRPTVFLSHAQFPMGFMTFVVKARGDAARTIAPVRALVQELDGDLPTFQVRSMEQLVADAVAQPRAYLFLLALFAGMAVLLAALGIYGVLMHVVAQRTREIGIRLALGAERGTVIRDVVTHAGFLAGAGLAVGLVLAVATTRLIGGLLFQIDRYDAATYAVVSGSLFVVALVASYVPARRAARIDPVRALRYE